jgi:hypothetical protein
MTKGGEAGRAEGAGGAIGAADMDMRLFPFRILTPAAGPSQINGFFDARRRGRARTSLAEPYGGPYVLNKWSTQT